MINFLKKTLAIISKSNRKVKGTSSVELIFFLLICCFLTAVSYKVYNLCKRKINKMYGIIEINSKKLDEKLQQIEEEINQENFNQ